ncbi:MAG: hypothetical protein CVU89_12820 [Firmicutes bacterium HGW-Firmicutes-14]|nr:MAG: hypothetical protein CVU89_12820 [Firmicutes bacterium HGW-Firmicutes-14]
MEWWLAGLIFLALAATAAILPWSIIVVFSSGEGFNFRLRYLKKIPVLTVRADSLKKVRVRLMGFICFEVKAGKKRKKAPKGPESPEGKKQLMPGRVSAALQAVTLDTIIQMIRYFRGIIGDTKTQMEISGEIGLGDPACTGMAYGFAHAFLGAMGIRRIHITPNFMEPVVDGYVKLTATVYPLAVLVRTLRTLFSPSIRKVWFALLVPRRTIIIEEVQNIGS